MPHPPQVSPTAAPRSGRYRTGRLIALTGALVGGIYGYDTGSISGALVFLSKDFHLATAVGATRPG